MLTRKVILFIGLMASASMLHSQSVEAEVRAEIVQSRGVDADVDYAGLAAFGPWDDRNYALTEEDIALLSEDEAQLSDPIPAFFRVQLRRDNPNLPKSGEAQYPLSALNAFNQMHGGYQLDGKIYKGIRRIGAGEFVYREDRETKAWRGWPKFLNGESKISTPAGAAESAISINPVDTVAGAERVIAGTNGPGSGQRMWRSSDGGSTWVESQPLTGGGTCCDPTVSWSTDGTKAYTSALVNCGSSCGIRFYRSDDNGNIWGDNDAGTPVPPPVTLVASGSDKQFIHVDAHPSSPFLDRIHLCWHESNVQKFAFSSDFGVSFTRANLPSGSVDAGARAVGCDVTSDTSGNVYYFYPTLDSGDAATRRQIRVAKSTDGGVNFSAPAVTVANNQDAFNYGLPSMETRKVAKIVQADADTSGGPFNDSVYVIWPDITAPENTANPASNHSIVRVGYSRDGGATWTVTSPHSLADTATVDRYQPSIKVDRLGRVHVIYYDTTRSADRTAVDVYYNVSYDGAQTWSTPRRVTAELSPNVNDNFEFGDYSHMDGVLDNIIAIYTDNRDEAGGANPSKDVYSAAGFQDPFTPGFLASALPESQDVCAGGTAQAVTLSLRGVLGFGGDVTLSTPALPATISNVQFSVNPVTASSGGNSSELSFSTSAGASGDIDLTVRAENGSALPAQRDLLHRITAHQPVTLTPSLSLPAANASNVATAATLSWEPLAGAASYEVQVASDAAFSNVVSSGTVTGTSFTTGSLQADTIYFWRVRGANICGDGGFSASRSFRTSLEFCSAPALAIPDNNVAGVTDDLVVPGSFTGNIEDMNVTVQLRHTFIGDLRISVRPVGGTPNVQLINNPAGCNGDDINTSFDDESANAFACNNAAVPAVGPDSVRPLQVLSAFDGLPVAGTWQILVADTAGADLGTLDRWCLAPQLPSTQTGLFADGFE